MLLNKQTAWGMCKFVPSRPLEVRQVEFWAADVTVDVDVYIYDDFDGSAPSHLLVSQMDNAFDMAGYHAVRLDKPVMVDADEDIYVVMKVTTAVSKFPLVYDSNGPGAPGCCYMSSNGTDFNEFTYGDIGIRLRAGSPCTCAGLGEGPVITDISDMPGDGGGYVSLAWTRSKGDTGESGDTKWYRVWRKRREALPPILQSSGFDGPEVAGPYQHGIEGPAWETIGKLGATGSCSYTFAAPTQCDCTPADTCWTCFCVTAHTGVPGEHLDSPIVRGYSIDNKGTSTETDGGQVDSSEPDDRAPTRAFLGPVTPNPSSDGFAIEFGVSSLERVKLSVYDVRGREVATIIDGTRDAGSHTAAWRPGFAGTPPALPGIYFLRLAVGSEIQTMRLALLD